jgi:hypothetical protein
MQRIKPAHAHRQGKFHKGKDRLRQAPSSGNSRVNERVRGLEVVGAGGVLASTGGIASPALRPFEEQEGTNENGDRGDANPSRYLVEESGQDEDTD